MNFFELQKESETKVRHFQFMCLIFMIGLDENILNGLVDEFQSVGNYRDYFYKNVLTHKQNFWFKKIIAEYNLNTQELNDVFSSTNTTVRSPVYSSEKAFYFLTEIILLVFLKEMIFSEQLNYLKAFAKSCGIDEIKFDYIFQEFQKNLYENGTTINDMRNYDFKKVQEITLTSFRRKFISL